MDDTNAVIPPSSPSSSSFTYQDGEEMKQTWNVSFVAFAYAIACVSSYSAVHLLDHGLWRSEELKKAAIIKHPDLCAALMLGFGTVWSMHFVGMAAVTLENTPICYNWPITFGSLGAVLALMIAGIKLAGNDVFASPNRLEILQEIVANKFGFHLYDEQQRDKWAIQRICTFHKLHWLGLGSFLAASGAVVMHYTGMLAQRGPFRKVWKITYIVLSVAAAIVICFVGFWIIFRLRWKIKQLWLRYVSAAVISLAVCGLHFFGMLSVKYVADSNAQNTCEQTWRKNDASPSAWTDHQMIVVAIGVFVPTLALYIANVINQELVIAYQVAARSNAIVSELFPTQVKDRLLADDKSKLKNFLVNRKGDEEDEDNVNIRKSKPIADLFTDTTIMFADLVGFTAWSSTREPCQVFTLLETIFHSFDAVCNRYGAFKVETVGDCYVAVCGLPNPRKDHAVVMCRVARECLYKMSRMAKMLEAELGPETADIQIRVGLHSGPVTGGVLRGERARFQLFGDTMNFASRMESTGSPGRIQISAETVELLKNAEKGHWTTPRDNKVMVKGKGEMATFWLQTDSDSLSSQGDSKHSMNLSLHSPKARNGVTDMMSDKTQRLIEWNVDVLACALKRIVAHRNTLVRALNEHRASLCVDNTDASSVETSSNVSFSLTPAVAGKTVLDEVCETIDLPEITGRATVVRPEDVESVVLPAAIVEQLKDYVTSLSVLYHKNAFHNFEHASHVTMSVRKLLSRMVLDESSDMAYGIASDPLTQFACIFSSLIHDVDHQGVPNAQLVKEKALAATVYKNKSVAEQNSVDLTWNLLMDDKYKELRGAVYTSQNEMRRFRQLVVNSVMATDIMDKELSSLRNARWEKAFSETATYEEDQKTAKNRKATIVIEHLIQASDVAHTMQHWHIYRKWNERLFEECYQAYKDGRSDADPSLNWYKGELGFFDFYVIPLAKKLSSCGVFGVSSAEYLSYAEQNRKEWEIRGQEIVSQMVERVKDKA